MCGICTSELTCGMVSLRMLFFHRHGHEPSGVIKEVGRNVGGFNVGDHVTFLSETGYFAEYAKAKKSSIVKIANNIPFASWG